MRARADGRAEANHISYPLGVGHGDALAPEDAERLLLTGGAARASDSLVKEVKRCLVEAPAIFLGNGDEGVTLGINKLEPVVNLLVGPGVGGCAW